MRKPDGLRVILLAATLTIWSAHYAQAKVMSPENAIEHADIAVVGTLAEIQMGTFSDPSLRYGELTVLKVLKGSPPGQSFRLRLRSNWGEPCFSARLGTISFWVFVAASIAALAGIALMWKFKKRWEAIVGTICLLLFLLILYPVTMTVIRSGWPNSPAEWVGSPRLWALYSDSKPENTGIRAGYAYRLEGLKPELDRAEKSRGPHFEEMEPNTQKALLLLRTYLENP